MKITQRIEHITNEIREARNEADGLGEEILLFTVFSLLLFGIIAVGIGILALAFTLPRFFIPLYIVIFVLWQGYKRL